MGNPYDVRRALAGNKNLRGADLTEEDLSNADLTEADLSRADLSDANLTDVWLTSARLIRAKLIRANLLDAALPSAKLTRADLTEADLIRTDLIEADLTEADLTDANLDSADLTRAKLTRAKLTRANLVEAKLPYANLRGADLRGADLTDADLTRANLRGADLTGADLTDADLTDAKLEGAKGLKPRVSARGSAYGRASGAVLKLLAEGPQSARDYKRRHPAEFERLKALTGGKDFDERTIRTIVEKTRGARWIITRKKYRSDIQRLCGNANDVLLLNIDLDAADLTAAQKESLRKLAAVSKRSGHPHETGSLFTVGWVRYCDGGKVWLVEEVQSDVQAARYGLKDEKAREQLAAGGIDPESFEDAIAAIRPYTERFYEDALGITFALAKQKGIAVEMLTYESKRSMGSPQNVYAELPRSMGMVRRDRSEVLPDAPAWYYRPNPRRRARRKPR